MKKYVTKTLISLLLCIVFMLSAVAFDITVNKSDISAVADTTKEENNLTNESIIDNQETNGAENTELVKKPETLEKGELELSINSDTLLSSGKFYADLKLPSKMQEYYYEEENLKAADLSIVNNQISAKLNTEEGLGKLKIHFKDEGENWQEASIFTYTSDNGCFLSAHSEDDAWYKCYLDKYESGMATLREIERDYAVFSRRGIERVNIADEPELKFSEELGEETLSDLEISEENRRYDEEMASPSATYASGSKDIYVYGWLTWTTSTGSILPLKYTKVELYDEDVAFDDLLATTYTDANGYYSFTVENDDSLAEMFGCDVFIKWYAESYTMRVARDWLLGEDYTYYYFVSDVVDNVKNGSDIELSYVHYYKTDNATDCAFYVEQGMVIGQQFAFAMGMKTDNQITVQYAFTDKDPAFCYYSVAGIGKERFNDIDTLIHEYGHFVEGVMGTYGNNVLEHAVFNPTHTLYADHLEDKANKNYAMELTWSESWANAFSMVAQECFKADYQGYIKDFADKRYHGVNIESITDDLDEKYIINRGECQEYAVTCFLWDLFDSGGDESYDKIGLGYYYWWDITTVSGITTLTQFSNKFYKFYPEYRSQFGEIMSAHQISAGNLKITNSSKVSQSTPPQLSWQINGSINHPNNRFKIAFYDNYGNLIHLTDLYSCALAYDARVFYTIDKSDWEQVTELYAGTYTVNIAVLSYHQSTLTLSGPYYSRYASITLTNQRSLTVYPMDRYCESIIVLDKGQVGELSVQFPTNGSKLIQTFGTLDTKMELLSSDGTVLASNDDGGYRFNALIRYYVYADVQYTIRVQFYSPAVYGKLKIGITPAYGALMENSSSLNSFEDIYTVAGESGFSRKSFAEKNYTRVTVFNPPTSGEYTFTLESDFDTYIYVLDPRSTAVKISGKDYDDDSGEDYNPLLTKTLDANIPYLIIYSAYNISTVEGYPDLRIRVYKN